MVDFRTICLSAIAVEQGFAFGIGVKLFRAHEVLRREGEGQEGEEAGKYSHRARVAENRVLCQWGTREFANLPLAGAGGRGGGIVLGGLDGAVRVRSVSYW
ncbi:hypothetical protein NBRC116593_07960 [Sulfitobacter pacificus]